MGVPVGLFRDSIINQLSNCFPLYEATKITWNIFRASFGLKLHRTFEKHPKQHLGFVISFNATTWLRG